MNPQIARIADQQVLTDSHLRQLTRWQWRWQQFRMHGPVIAIYFGLACMSVAGGVFFGWLVSWIPTVLAGGR